MSNEIFHITSSEGSLQGRDTQNLLIQLWELIRNSVEKINLQKQQISELRERNLMLEKVSADDQKRIADNEGNIEFLKKEIEKLSGNKSYYIDLVKTLETKLEDSLVYKAELDELKERYERAKIDSKILEEKQAKIENLNDKIDELTKTQINLNHDNSELKEKIHKLDADMFNYEQTQKELTKKNIMINDRINEIQRLKEKLAIEESKTFLARQHETTIAHLKDEIKELTSKNSDEIDILKIENSSYQKKLTLLNDEIKSLKIEIGNFEVFNQTLEENLNNSKNINSELRNEILDLRKIIDEKEAQIKSLNNEIEEFNELLKLNDLEIIKNEEKIAELSKNINILKGELEVSQSSNLLKQSEMNELNSQFERLKNEINDYQILLDEKFSENQQLSDKIKLYEDERSKLTNELKQSKEQTEKLKNDIDNLYSEIDNVRVAVEMQFVNEIDTYNKKIEKLSWEITQLNKDLISSKNEKTILEHRLTDKDEIKNDLENQLKTAGYEIDELKRNIDTLKNKLAESEHQISDLKDLLSKRTEQIAHRDLEISNLSLKEFNYELLQEQYDNLVDEFEIYKNKYNQFFESAINEKDLLINQLTNNNKISELTISNLNKRIEDLEELVKVRYEQINILEIQINELIEEKEKISEIKTELKRHIHDYLHTIDNELTELK